MRSYSDWLRSLDEPAVTRLLRLRPDLCLPVPRSIADLASRASTDTSVGRALDSLDAWQRSVCLAAAAAGDSPHAAEAGWLLESDPEPVAQAFDDLVERGLAWYAEAGAAAPERRLLLVRAARTCLGVHPGGLAPPSPRPLTDEQIAAAWDELGDAEHDLAERLVWNPTGSVRNADQRGTGSSPTDRLIATGLLRVHGPDRVVLPREVALRLRRPRRLLADPPGPQPPHVSAEPSRSASLVDRAAVGAAFELTSDVEQLAEELSQPTARRLIRDGSLGQRDLTAIARGLGTDTGRAGWLVELAWAAGLVNRSSATVLLPTLGYDRWLNRPVAERWAALVQGWLRSDRWFADPDRTRTLAPEAEWRVGAAARIRTTLSRVIDSAAPGSRLDPDLLREAMAWHRPALRQPVGGDDPASAVRTTGLGLVDELWREVEWLGLLGLGCVTTAGGRWGEPDLVAALGSLFPVPVGEIIIQSDLTAVAAGPLTAQVAAGMRLLADSESRGAAGVFRFSAASLRRAFDAGWQADQVTRWMDEHAPTGVPQPLQYLVADVARQFGTIRVGAAGAYIRTDDEAHAAAVLLHPDASLLGIRRLGPGVLVAEAEPAEVVALLRSMHLAPAAENAAGHMLTTPASPRAPEPTARPAPADPAVTAAALLRAEQQQVRLVRDTETVLQVLETAHRNQVQVTVAFVADDGTPQVRTVVPISLGAGRVRLTDGSVPFTLSLARISSAGWPG